MRLRFGSIIRWATALGCLVCLVGGGAPGEVRAASTQLSDTLGDIEWGDSRDEVLQKLKRRMLDALKERPDLKHDRVKMQEARKRALDRHERIVESFERLEGNKTGYEVSVIAGEFTKNNGESLLRVNDKMAQRFYFFVDGALYKKVVAYKQSAIEGVDFRPFIKKVAAKYGRPTEANSRTIDGEKQLHNVRWADGDTLLRVEDAREFFGTFKMVYSDRNTVESLRAAEGAFGGSEKSDQEVSARVQDLTDDSEPATGDEENVVDSMIGESVEVDLSPSTGESDEEAESSSENDDVDKGKEDQKTAGKTDDESETVDGVMDSDDTEQSEDDDEPLIIY